MSVSSSELKRRAKQSLKGKYGLCIGAQFLVEALVLVIVIVYAGVIISLGIADNSFFSSESGRKALTIMMIMIFLSYLAVLSLAGLLTPGMNRLYLNLCVGRKAGLSDLLYGFQNKPHRFLGLFFMNILISLAWGIPYLVVMAVAVITDYIPVMVVLLVLMYVLWLIGIIVTMLFLSQSQFLLLESPDKKVFACFKESAEMMKGRKGKLFSLYLSFCGMVVLGYLSLGIGFLWIMPYIRCTVIEFYLDLKAARAPRPQETYEETSFGYMWEQENQR